MSILEFFLAAGAGTVIAATVCLLSAGLAFMTFPADQAPWVLIYSASCLVLATLAGALIHRMERGDR